MITPQRAYKIVRTAVSNGKLSKPDNCGRCGKRPRRGSDGRSLLHAHHHNYNRPLDVEWICAWCHRKETPPALGERTPKAKLTGSVVVEIRKSNEPSKVLAKKYGMEKTAIERVRSGRTWSHIKAAEDVK